MMQKVLNLNYTFYLFLIPFQLVSILILISFTTLVSYANYII